MKIFQIHIVLLLLFFLLLKPLI